MVKEGNKRISIVVDADTLEILELLKEAGYCETLTKEYAKAMKAHLKHIQRIIEKDRNEAVKTLHNTQYEKCARLYNDLEWHLYSNNYNSKIVPESLFEARYGTEARFDKQIYENVKGGKTEWL